jgi:LPS-assembly lipoprotein
MLQSPLPIAALVLLAMSLGACGFHLRGDVDLSPRFERTLLEAQPLESNFRYELQRTLESGGVELVDTLEQATGILSVRAASRDRRVLSVDSAGKVAEYELIARIEIAAREPDGAIIFEPRTLTSRRSMQFNPDQALGSEGEEVILREDMRRELAGMVLLSLRRSP